MSEQKTAKGRRRAAAGALFVLLAVLSAGTASASLPSPADPAAMPDLLTPSASVAGVSGFLLEAPAVDLAAPDLELALTVSQLGRALHEARGAENRVRVYHGPRGPPTALGRALSDAFTRAYPLLRSSFASGGSLLTKDPLGYVDGPSAYAFAMNSPVNYGDPLGLCVGGLRETELCKAVNSLVSPAPAIRQTGEVEGVRSELETAKQEAIRVVNGVAVSSRITFRPFRNLDHGPISAMNAIVLHQTGGGTAESTLNTYGGTTKSGRPWPWGAHFLIGYKGEIYQTLELDRKAAHVGSPLYSRCKDDLRYCSPPASANTVLSVAADLHARATNTTPESQKAYPYRYPMNSDSIGIEVANYCRDPATGKAPSWSPLCVYDRASGVQNESLAWLSLQLKRIYGFDDDDFFRHPDIKKKNATEAESLEWRVRRIPTLESNMPRSFLEGPLPFR